MVDVSLIDGLRAIVGGDGVLSDPVELLPYESDAFSVAKATGRAVVLPTETEQVAAIVKLLAEHDVQVVPRGSGTGLAGGCTAYGDGVTICTSRMNRVLEVDLANRTACVQAGVYNTALSKHVQGMPGGEGLHFSPDPSSQTASTIGGNAATNAGGIHTLKHGVTSNHVLGVEMVMGDGSVVWTGGGLRDRIGPDTTGLICGSEGTFGIITRVWVKLEASARAFRTIVGIFSSSRDAGDAVSEVIGAGIIPAAMEMMDGKMVQVIEDAFGYGFPADAAALLLIEIDGLESVLDEQMRQIVEICERHHGRDVQCSADAARRAELWSARKRAFGAIGRISPSYCTQDACVPRSMLADVLERIGQIGEKYGITITNVFHAGDGNVHPILLFDEAKPDEVRKALEASHELLRYCISIGGALTGEHGVGVEKLGLMTDMFDGATMGTFAKLKGIFDPAERLNVGKLMPSEKVVVDLLAAVGANVPGGAL
ncbi:MAG: FAD-binding oxidoreductase [Planctomycetaceae bacterium]|nr:FAD-binding oxidoreductase [Planctomycetaceae bacterium]